MFEVSSMTRFGYTLNASTVRFLLSLVVAASCFSTLIVPSGYTLGYALLLLASIPLLLQRSVSVEITASSKILMSAFLAYFVLHALGNLAQGAALRRYDESAHYLLSIPILWLLCKFPIEQKYWWAGISLGAVGGGVFAIVQVFFLGYFRASGFMVAIQFGDLCILFSAFCLLGINNVYRREGTLIWLALLIFGAVMGLLGSFLSGARGGWLAVPVIFCVVYSVYGNQRFRRFLSRAFLLSAVVLAIMYWVPQTGIERRIDSAVTDYQGYVSGEDVNTSLGLRLEMWRLSIGLIAERPLFGWGETGYQETMLARIENEEVREIVADFDHVHNDALDVLIKRGLVGLVAFILLFIVPLGLFVNHIKHEITAVKTFAVAGVVLVLCVLIFGFTQTFFIHNSGVTMYAFLLVVIWSLLQNSVEKKTCNSKENSYE